MKCLNLKEKTQLVFSHFTIVLKDVEKYLVLLLNFLGVLMNKC